MIGNRKTVRMTEVTNTLLTEAERNRNCEYSHIWNANPDIDVITVLLVFNTHNNNVCNIIII